MPYQAILLAKVGFVGLLVALAVVNRYVFVPQIQTNGRGIEKLRNGTIAEVVLSAAIIAFVSLLGSLPPS
ncbi:MAG: CopD family protein [Devosia sp.]